MINAKICSACNHSYLYHSSNVCEFVIHGINCKCTGFVLKKTGNWEHAYTKQNKQTLGIIRDDRGEIQTKW